MLWGPPAVCQALCEVLWLMRPQFQFQGGGGPTPGAQAHEERWEDPGLSAILSDSPGSTDLGALVRVRLMGEMRLNGGGEDPWQRSHGTHCQKHGVNTMPACGPPCPSSIQPPSPQDLSKVLGRGAVEWWLLSFHHLATLRSPGQLCALGSSMCASPHPGFQEGSEAGVGGRGRIQGTSASFCLPWGGILCTFESEDHSLAGLPPTYINPCTELSSLVHQWDGRSAAG